ncbi:YdeI/OmpD-associated family protein [Agrococcus jejuensis]|uniref:DUF1905 domain-containing protein n=1 Tax=Agrococcus jejuensis TaxID=399736 RepID=A0A1G8H3K5_9MICO|nr:YdeI/OmpD-associated family protein [Agrococcus jejuensis]SDI01206.1 protein of unknown function [Agrococcus jejuensis]
MAKTASPVAIRFDGDVVQVGDRRIVRVPADVSATLPSRGQVAVTGSIGGVDAVTVVEPDGEKGHWLDAGAAQGDTVKVDLAVLPSKQWPEPTVPADLGGALDDSTTASARWQAITPMARWEWVRWVGATRNPETRSRRVEVSISKLDAGSSRPCCFDLSSCTDPELARSGRLVAD